MPNQLVVDHAALADAGAEMLRIRAQFEREPRLCRDPVEAFGAESVALAYLTVMRVHDGMLDWLGAEAAALAALLDETSSSVQRVDGQLATALSVPA
ncbi:hypothetical protein [Curtobacterium ammoniigenes]|uniref:hypothetical protein n=1 Tax=Curtobacterium ammoniigenes TaxID=395387 RepID=UPI00082CDDCC|nr:hypothetical protein [Curtobacterium ammoniigenes]